ncbi:MAG: toll/interleukin-1 receptor domain-containing protein [Pseudomonadota bacterium]
MTVYISFAEADRDAAESLERFLERRGHFSELDNGEVALRPVGSADAVVLVVSKDFVFYIQRLRLEQRALDAWAEGRLILVKLDKGFAPVGLRDLPAIDASFEANRDFVWGDVHAALDELKRAPSRREAAAPSPPSAAPAAPTRSRAAPAPMRKAGGGSVLPSILMIPGALALTAIVAIWFANRIGPTPGAWGDLVSGIDALGGRYGAPHGLTPALFAGALVLFVLAAMTAVIGRVKPSAPQAVSTSAAPEEDGETPAPSSDTVFVSYASANAQLVHPLIDAARQQGRAFWLDRDGLKAGDNWAGEIVRAIRGAGEVLVMCSQAAFESDHVKREIYLADRYKKKLVPIFIEEAKPPEDFEYFFAGVQWLKLFETPELERPAAVLRVLETAA